MSYSGLKVWDGWSWVSGTKPSFAVELVAATAPPTSVQKTLALALTTPATVRAGSAYTVTLAVTSGGVAFDVPVSSVRFATTSGTISGVTKTGTGVYTAKWTPSSAAGGSRTVTGSVTEGATWKAASTAKTATVQTLRSGTVSLAASWTASYGALGSRGATPLYRGYYSSTHGDQWATVGFPALSLPSGATITKAEVWLYAEHWWSNAGGTLALGLLNRTAASSSYDAGTSAGSVTWTTKTGGKWITLSSATVANLRCVVLRKSGGTSQTSYGYFSGLGGTSRPNLRVSYTYWA